MQHPKSITPEIEGKSFLVEIPTQSGQIYCRVLLQESEQTFEWQIEVNGPEQQVSLHSPFLSALSAGENSHWVDFYSLKNRQGQVMARRRDFNAPLVVTNGDCSLVIQQQGPLIEGVYSPEQLLNAPGLNILVQNTPKTIYQGTIVLVEGGWREAFGQIRSHLRTQVDLSEYQREDLKWYSDQFVQHFTFLYGREILDLDKGEFNLERFLTDGERDFAVMMASSFGASTRALASMNAHSGIFMMICPGERKAQADVAPGERTRNAIFRTLQTLGPLGRLPSQANAAG